MTPRRTASRRVPSRRTAASRASAAAAPPVHPPVASRPDFHAQQFFMASALLAFALALVLIALRLSGTSLLSALPREAVVSEAGTVALEAGTVVGAVLRLSSDQATSVFVTQDGIVGLGDTIAEIPARNGELFRWKVPDTLPPGTLLFVSVRDPGTDVILPFSGSPLLVP